MSLGVRTEGKRIRFLERTMFKRNGESTPRIPPRTPRGFSEAVKVLVICHTRELAPGAKGTPSSVGWVCCGCKIRAHHEMTPGKIAVFVGI